jgi:NADH-quinone oxidoreductase subunit J
MDSAELFLAIGFLILAIAAAVGFVAFRQPVHAALSFALTVLSGAGLYLLLDAPYAAIATVIVYAGATIIIFLFALMFAQRSTLQSYDKKMANPTLSGIAAISLTAVMIYVLTSASIGSIPSSKNESEASVATRESAEGTVADTASPPRVADLGRVMYTQYLWAIELAGAILLVATLGAIHVAKDDSQAISGAEGVQS